MKKKITIETRSRPLSGPLPGTAYYRVALVNGREVATLAHDVGGVREVRALLKNGGAL